MNRVSKFLFSLLFLLIFGGCSQNDGRVAIEGQVTVDGQPLSMAVISFQPLDEQGRSSGTSVQNGSFKIDAQHGLLPGTYRVKIQAFRETGKLVFDPQRQEKIAETAQVVLRDANQQQITVAAGAKNDFSLAFVSAAR